MELSHQDIIRNLDQNDKMARKASLVGWSVGIGGLFIAGGVEMYEAFKCIGAGWAKEFWKTRWHPSSSKWANATFKNPVWQAGVGIGLASIAFAVSKGHKADTLGEVRNASLDEPLVSAGMHWKDDRHFGCNGADGPEQRIELLQ